MQIQYYKEFVVLAETLNFWAAAEALFISQSVLSKHIRAMERELGAPLFVRTSRRVALTELGQKLLPTARRICDLQAKAEALARQAAHSGRVRLRVAALPDIAHYGFSQAVIRFQRQFPEAELEVEEMDTQPAREALLAGRCDLAICRESGEAPPAEPLQTHALFCERLMAVLPAGHALAGQQEAPLAEMANDGFALIARGSLPYSLCVQACQNAGFTPHIQYTGHRIDSILDMAAAGCTALLFERHLPAAAARPGGIRVLPVTPPVYSTVYLAVRKEEAPGPALAALIRCCRQAMAKTFTA